MTRFLAPLLIGIAGAAILVWLGTWQVQRLAWKEGVLAAIETRLAADPVPLPADPDPARDQYLSVALSGASAPPELHVLVSHKQLGPGFRIVTAFATETGRRVLLDQGFVADEHKAAPRSGVSGPVTGNLNWPDDRTASTPQNDEAGNIWFARDLDRMAAVLGTEPVLVMLRDGAGRDPAVTPLPLDTAAIPNDHLQYAVTWFSLAAIWLGMTGFWLWRIRPRNRT